MGDGGKLNNSIVLCTDSFTLIEVVKLVNVLKIKFDLNCSIQGINLNKPRIYFLIDSHKKLVDIIKPYVINFMLYKLNI